MMRQLIEQQAALRAAGRSRRWRPTRRRWRLADAEVIDETPPAGAARPGFDETDPATWGDPGRNDPCPCGSGKKFKHCHGRL